MNKTDKGNKKPRYRPPTNSQLLTAITELGLVLQAASVDQAACPDSEPQPYGVWEADLLAVMEMLRRERAKRNKAVRDRRAAAKQGRRQMELASWPGAWSNAATPRRESDW